METDNAPMEALKPERIDALDALPHPVVERIPADIEARAINIYETRSQSLTGNKWDWSKANEATQNTFRLNAFIEQHTRPATDGLRGVVERAINGLNYAKSLSLNTQNGKQEVDEVLYDLKDALAATPQAPADPDDVKRDASRLMDDDIKARRAAPPVLPSDEETAKALATQIAEALWSDGLIDDADAVGGYVQDVLTPALAAHRTAHQNAGDWDMKAVKLVGAISALKGYTTTTGPGTPDYFQRLRDHYIAELEKAAAAFLPPLPTPPRNGRVG